MNRSLWNFLFVFSSVDLATCRELVGKSFESDVHGHVLIRFTVLLMIFPPLRVSVSEEVCL